MVSVPSSKAEVFKADAPETHKDKLKYGFGSIIKDKDSFLYGVFHKKKDDSQSCAQAKTQAKDAVTAPTVELKVEKVKPTTNGSKKDLLFDAAIKVLKDFPLELVDKKAGKIETGLANVEHFDNTRTYTYKVVVNIKNEKDFSVKIISHEDSNIRLSKYEEYLKDKITKAAETKTAQ